jgi:hypothetical protein
VSIGRGGSSSGSINLGYVGTYIYWVTELLVVAGIAFLCTFGAALEPYCRKCHSWKHRHKLGGVGATPEETAQAVRDGAVTQLEPVEEEEPVRLQVYVCPNCRGRAPVVVLAESVHKKEKDQESTNELAQVTYPGKALAVLRRLYPDADLGDVRR